MQTRKGEPDYESSSVTQPILAILDYFVRHPQAVDSAEGIAQWRLLDELSRLSLKETEEGLLWLVAQGYLLKMTVPGNRRVYGLNPERLGEAAQYLRENRREGPSR